MRMISDVLLGLSIFQMFCRQFLQGRRDPTVTPAHLESDENERIHHLDSG